MDTIRIAFYKGGSGGISGTILHNFISWWTRGPYSHCAVIFNTDPVTKVSQCADSNIGTGVAFYSEVLDPAEWDIINMSFYDSVKCKAWFTAHEGQGYDYTGLLGIISPVGNEYKHWFCSEAVAASLGVKQPWRFDPNRLVVLLREMGGTWDHSYVVTSDSV
jgi:hypothetical protein